jgi:hypothetical protein
MAFHRERKEEIGIKTKVGRKIPMASLLKERYF